MSQTVSVLRYYSITESVVHAQLGKDERENICPLFSSNREIHVRRRKNNHFKDINASKNSSFISSLLLFLQNLDLQNTAQ